MRLESDNYKLLPRARSVSVGAGSNTHCDWAAETSIEAYGVRVGVRANRRELLDKLLAILPNLWKHSSAPSVERLYSLELGRARASRTRRSYLLYEDEQIIANSEDLSWVLDTFDRQLKIYLAEMAHRRVFVHAGAVGWRGKAIIIPGRGFSGKTSLVAELVRAGATYYSDEYAVLDDKGRVHPYAAPLEIRQPGSHQQVRCKVEEIGGVSGTKPLPVGLVVVSRYKPAERWRPRLLSAGQSILELLNNTVPARRKPEAVIATLKTAVARAITLKGARGEAAQTARLILDHHTE
jgi:hypothetical protein